jgi:ATP-binding cassette subfamily B protein
VKNNDLPLHDILLLDEPTSSVDALNEHTIYSNILEQYADKCVISAIHKLHLLDMFDYIYLFSDGQIIEQGTLKSLLDQDGLLAKMYRTYQRTQVMSPEDSIQ